MINNLEPCLKISWPNIQISFSSSFSSLWFSTDWDGVDCEDCDGAVSGMIERQPNNPTSLSNNHMNQSIHVNQSRKKTICEIISSTIYISFFSHLPSLSSFISHSDISNSKLSQTKIGRTDGPNKRMMIATMRYHVTTYILFTFKTWFLLSF